MSQHWEPKVDFECRVDEVTRHVRQYLDLRTGFGEDHAKARVLQNIFKHFDLDHTNSLSRAEFGRVLTFMSILTTPDEQAAVFDRYDTDRCQSLSYKEFSDAFFGARYAPLGDVEARQLIDSVRTKLLQRAGDEVVRGLTRCFALLDKDGSQSLSKEELFNGLQRYGVLVTLQECAGLVKKFDRLGKGALYIPDFLRAIRGHMSIRRAELVEQAFFSMDEGRKGYITVEHMLQRFDVSKHPAVLRGQRSAKEIMTDFMGQWGSVKNGRVEFNDFQEYYQDLSACIEAEDYFELMIRNAWHLSGGPRSAENTTCRRVLVSYKDGHQTIEEITNDLGIKSTDIDKMKKNLEARGIRDIVSLELYA